MKTLTLNKKELIKLWKSRCSGVETDTVLERTGTATEQMCSIKIDNDLSLAIFLGDIKLIFGGQIEYLSEELTDSEFEELQGAFVEAEDTIERLNRDRIMSSGIKALERLLDN
jgi:hypothetical protein